MMWLFIFFLWVFAAALFSMALGKAIRIGDSERAERDLINRRIAVLELQLSGGAR
jgi:hypothetical protein